MPLETYTNNGTFSSPYGNNDPREIVKVFAIAISGGGAGGSETGGGGGGANWGVFNYVGNIDIQVSDGGNAGANPGSDNRDGGRARISSGGVTMQPSEGDAGRIDGTDNGNGGGDSAGFDGEGGEDGKGLPGPFGSISDNTLRGGAAGTSSSGGDVSVSTYEETRIRTAGSQAGSQYTVTCYEISGGSGNGAEIRPQGSGNPGNDPIKDVSGTNGGGSGADGVPYGAGGGGYAEGLCSEFGFPDSSDGIVVVQSKMGDGGPAVAYITYVSIDANIDENVYNENTFDLPGNSWWDGNFSEQVTADNINANRNIITQTFTITDSRGAESRVTLNVYPDPIINEFEVSFPGTPESYFSGTNTYVFTSSKAVPFTTATLSFVSDKWRPEDANAVEWEIRRIDDGSNSLVGSGNAAYQESSKKMFGSLTLDFPRTVGPTANNNGGDTPKERTYRLTVKNQPGDYFKQAQKDITIRWYSDDNYRDASLNISNAILDQNTLPSILDYSYKNEVPIDELEAAPWTSSGPGQGFRYYVIVTWDGTDMNLSARSGTFDNPNDPYAGNNYDEGVSDGVTTEAGTRLSLDGASFSNTVTVPEGQNLIYVRFRADGFNPSTNPPPPEDTNEDGLVIGEKTAPRSINFTLGAKQVTFNIQTRKPVIEEVADFFLLQPPVPNTSITTMYPYEDFPFTGDSSALLPDIDTVDEYDPTAPKWNPSNVITTDNIEVPVEITSNDPDVQVRINGGAYQDVRETS